MEKAKLMVVDDHALFRSALSSLVARQSDMAIVAEAESGEAAVRKAQEQGFDLILMDINMKAGDGLEATRAIKSRRPDAKICVLTASDDDDLLFEAVRAGAQGYLLKHTDPQTFVDEIRRQLSGGSTISEEMAAKIVRTATRRSQAASDRDAGLGEFTDREVEVLALVGQGMTNREIALELTIAENTVKNHLRNILQKLHFDNRVQVAAYAIRHGLVK